MGEIIEVGRIVRSERAPDDSTTITFEKTDGGEVTLHIRTVTISKLIKALLSPLGEVAINNAIRYDGDILVQFSKTFAAEGRGEE